MELVCQSCGKKPEFAVSPLGDDPEEEVDAFMFCEGCLIKWLEGKKN